ncbi:RdgB/HAM1 family non-canonical purine NTP pyrophosphatase [Paraglaciecola aquimarina]|uniref:dITP/XTP pyrophosphatase n=1 Tax=Paraglaciecola algarum TaxID=3050085 RepID=A0ABS9D5P4_9ALTE|nr:RdgB/HAM1 family non-canonical purine NTP pyrophosphatase [Paraglaciecola sp. G1-23]MCF2948258.1 RdgB/HAM1 family non-canonical purine NTP pyrophosphatase [Paraglaciecola sp. G1-23]
MAVTENLEKVVLATGNQGKVKELGAMLSDLGIQVIAQSEFAVSEVAETGTTFVENAIIKARHASLATGLPAIADDSGLAVDALGGAPGVYSARYSEDTTIDDKATDQTNIDKLLVEMADVPVNKRQARFLCVLVFMRHADDPTPIICQGEWQGEISTKQFGENGFGYDPVFWVADKNCSSAQLSREQKNALSHRGQALMQLKVKLKAQIADQLQNISG